MKYYRLIIIALVLYGCKSQEVQNTGTSNQLFKYNVVTLNATRIDTNYKYDFFLPTGFIKEKTVCGGGHEICYLYIYRDSACVYLSNYGYNPNYNNIKASGDQVFNKRFESIILNKQLASEQGNNYYPETVHTYGNSINNLNWKDMRIDYFSFGYLNIKHTDTIYFNAFLKSVSRTK